VRVVRTRCEHLVDPLGIDAVAPSLSWALESDRRGDVQTAWRVRVSSSPDGSGDLWDSGRVPGPKTLSIRYGGEPLTSRTRCWWTVQAWDADGEEAEPGHGTWELGLLKREDWFASWIAAPQAAPVHLRHGFQVDRPVVRARAYATARGLYDLWLNGSRVGEDLLRPGWTDYRTRIQVQTYDITDLVVDGPNAVGVLLGSGWYAGQVGWVEDVYAEAGPVSALVQLELTHDDGSVTVVGSGPSWLAHPSHLLQSDLMRGEVCDLRLAVPGWSEASCDETGWSSVTVVPEPAAALVADTAPPVRRLLTLTPVGTWPGPDGGWIVDLGQNLVGRVRIRLDGPAGREVTLRHAEVLEPDGRLHVANLRTATSTDVVVLAGGPVEYEPTFTTHGFRYVEVTGVDEPPVLQGIVLGSDLPQVGSFACSNETVTQLQRNIEWSQRGNHLEVPTDCPQRDERLGWTGDAQSFVSTAACNADLTAFYGKWLTDLIDTQRADGAFGDVAPLVLPELFSSAAPGWGDAGTVVPMTLFQHYGDEALLERCYPAMRSWVERLHMLNPDLLWRQGRGNDYGDWVAVDADTPPELVSSAFLAHSTQLVAKAAALLGRDEDAARFADAFQRAREAFCSAYVTPSGRVFGGTQTSYVLPLAFDLVPAEQRPVLAQHLVEDIGRCGQGDFMARRARRPAWHLSTGFLGIRDLLPVLTESGHLDVAYRLLENETFPSWGYSVVQGATTIWERWDAFTVDAGINRDRMNSFNHYCFGSVGAWLFSTVAGLAPAADAVGYDRVVVRPRPGGSIRWARASHQSVRGEISSSWELSEDGFALDVRVPCNARAEVWLPTNDPARVTESGRPLAEAHGVALLETRGTIVLSVGSGDYRFLTPTP